MKYFLFNLMKRYEVYSSLVNHTCICMLTSWSQPVVLEPTSLAKLVLLNNKCIGRIFIGTTTLFHIINFITLNFIRRHCSFTIIFRVIVLFQIVIYGNSNINFDIDYVGNFFKKICVLNLSAYRTECYTIYETRFHNIFLLLSVLYFYFFFFMS
jgi:hypothetical protein